MGGRRSGVFVDEPRSCISRNLLHLMESQYNSMSEQHERDSADIPSMKTNIIVRLAMRIAFTGDRMGIEDCSARRDKVRDYCIILRTLPHS